MAVTICCVRHGQGLHNVGAGNYTLPDPRMTPLGEEQCREVRDRAFQDQSQISMIVASPQIRTIQTAMIIFRASLESSSPKTILAMPDLQETSSDACDVGSDLSVLRKICKDEDWPVDLSLVKDGWNNKSVEGRYSPGARALKARAREARIFLREQSRKLIAQGNPDPIIALVTHGSFLHFLTEDWENSDEFPSTGWRNCETRAYSYEFGVESSDDTDAHWVEIENSRQRRGIHHSVLPKDDQVKLFHNAMQRWEAQGLENPSKIDVIQDEIHRRGDTTKCGP